MRKWWLAGLVPALAGCMSFDVLDEELPKYTGRPIDSLVERIGYPNAERTIMGRKVYIWSTSMSHVSVTPVQSTSTGYVGLTPVTMTSTTYETSSSRLSCMLRVFVSAQDRIESFDYEGNNGACFRYSNRLKQP